jgi:carboxylesterase type B
MTDLVAALKWVHENIANFGGDPDRVMIYGQSGGGSKVTTLMGMPSAAGLFHRASVQSGGGGNIPTREQQREVTRLGNLLFSRNGELQDASIDFSAVTKSLPGLFLWQAPVLPSPLQATFCFL